MLLFLQVIKKFSITDKIQKKDRVYFYVVIVVNELFYVFMIKYM